MNGLLHEIHYIRENVFGVFFTKKERPRVNPSGACVYIFYIRWLNAWQRAPCNSSAIPVCYTWLKELREKWPKQRSKDTSMANIVLRPRHRGDGICETPWGFPSLVTERHTSSTNHAGTVAPLGPYSPLLPTALLRVRVDHFQLSVQMGTRNVFLQAIVTNISHCFLQTRLDRIYMEK